LAEASVPKHALFFKFRNFTTTFSFVAGTMLIVVAGVTDTTCSINAVIVAANLATIAVETSAFSDSDERKCNHHKKCNF